MVYKTLEAFPNGKKCLLCLTSVTDPEKLGEIYQSADVIIHYFCLLLASKVEQNGEDDKGILGFYPRDIKKEAKRAASIVCNYCKEGGACIFCVNENCSIAFHLPCGLDNGSYHHFFDGFDSFCKNHWKKQVIPAKLKKQVRDCVICSHPIIFSKEKYIWPPCCKPKALLHKRCTQRLASSAGYYMKCPLCNNKTDFCCGLRSLGVFIPEREASWEVEPHAFQELSQPIKECEAVVCKCPQGRTHCTLRSKNKKWCIEPCKLCGSIGIHYGCMQQQIRPGTFECSTCVGVSQRFTNNESGERGHEGEETIGSPENGEVMVEDYSSNPDSTSHESSDSEEFQEFRRARRRNREALSSNIILISSESEDEVSYDRSCPMPSPIRKSVPIRRRPQKRRTLQFVGESDGHQCSSTAVLSSVEESRTETETDGFPEVPLICNVFSLTSEEGRKSSETFELIDLYEGQHSYEFIEGQSMRQLEFEAAHSEEPTHESLPACENPPQTSSILQVNNVYNLSDAGFTLSLENKDTSPQVEPDVVSISDTESLRSSRSIIDIDSLIQSQLPLSEHFSKLAIAVAQQQSISKLKPKGKRKKKRTSVNSKKKKTIVNNSSTNDPIKTFSVNDKSSCNSVTDDLPGIEPSDVSNSSLIIEKQSVESQSSSNPTKHGRKDKKVLKVHSSLFNTNPLQKLNSGTDMNSDNDTPVALSKRRSRSDAAKEAKLSSLNLHRKTRNSSAYHIERLFVEQVKTDKCKEKVATATLLRKTRQATTCHSGRMLEEQAGINECEGKEITAALPRNNRDTSPSQCGRKSEEQVEPDECKEKEVIADLPRKTRQASACHSGRKSVEQAGMNEYKKKEVVTALLRNTRDTSPSQCGRKSEEQVEPDECKEKEVIADLPRKTRQASACHSGRKSVEQAGMNEYKKKEVVTALLRNTRDTSPSQCGRKSEEQVEPDECKEKEVIADLPKKTRQASACHSGRKSVEQAGMNEYKEKEVATALPRNLRDTSSQCGRKSEEQVEPDECKEKEVIADLPRKTRQASAYHSGRMSVEQAGMNEYKEKEVATALPRNTRDTSPFHCGRKSVVQVEPHECKEKEVAIAVLPRITRQASSPQCGRKSKEQIGMDESKEKEVTAVLPRYTRQASACQNGRISVEQVEPDECKEKEVIADLPRKTRQASAYHSGRMSVEQAGMNEYKEKEVATALPRNTRDTSPFHCGRKSVVQVEPHECKEKEVAIAVLPRKTRQASSPQCGRKSKEQIGMDESKEKEVTAVLPRYTRQASACQNGRISVEQVDTDECKEKEVIAVLPRKTRQASPSHCGRKSMEQVGMDECQQKEVTGIRPRKTRQTSACHSGKELVEQVELYESKEKESTTSIKSDTKFESSHTRRKYEEQVEMAECREKEVITSVRSDTLSESDFHSKGKSVEQVGMNQYREKDVMTSIQNDSMNESSSCSQRKSLEQGGDECRKSGVLTVLPNNTSCRRKDIKQVETIERRETESRTALSSVTRRISASSCENNFIEQGVDESIEKADMTYEKQDGTRRKKNLLGIRENFMNTSLGWEKERPEAYSCNKFYTQEVKALKINDELLDEHVQINVATESSKSSITELTEKCIYSNNLIVIDDKFNSSFIENSEMPLEKPDVMNDEHRGKSLLNVEESKLVLDKVEMGLVHMNPSSKVCLNEGGTLRRDRSSKKVKLCKRDSSLLNHNKTSYTHSASLFEEKQNNNAKEFKTAQLVQYDDVLTSKNINTVLDSNNDREQLGLYVLTDEKTSTELIEDYLEESGVPDNVTKSRHNEITDRKIQKLSHSKENKMRQPSGKGFRDEEVRTEGKVKGDKVSNKRKSVSSSLEVTNKRKRFEVRIDEKKGSRGHVATSKKTDKPVEAKVSSSTHLLITDDSITEDYAPDESERCSSSILFSPPQNDFTYKAFLPCSFLSAETSAEISDKLFSLEISRAVETNSDILLLQTEKERSSIEKTVDTNENRMLPNHLVADKTCSSIEENLESRTSAPRAITNCRSSSSGPSDVIPESQSNSSGASQAMPECHPSSSIPDCKTRNHEAINVISECETRSSIPSVTESSVPSEDISECQNSSSVPSQAMLECHKSSSGETHAPSVCETSTHGAGHAISECETGSSASSHAIPEYRASSSVPCQVLPECHPYSSGESQDISVCETSHGEIHPFSEWETECSGASHAIPESHASSSGLSDANLTIRSIVAQPIPNLIDTHCTEGGSTSSSVSWYKCCSTGCPTCENSSVYLTGRIAENFKESQLLKETPLNDQFFLRNGSEVTSTYTHEAPRIKETHKKNCRKESVIALEPGERGSPDKYGSIKKDYLCHKKLEVPDLSDVKDILGRTDGCADKPVVHSTQRLCTLNPDSPPHYSDSTNNLVKMNSEKLNMIEFEANLETCLPNSDDSPSRSLDISSSNIANKKNDLVSAPEMKQFLTKITHDPLTSNIINVHEVSHDQKLTFVNQNSEQKDSSFNQEILKSKVLLSKNASYISSSEVTSTRSDDNSYCSNVENLNEESVIESSSINSSLVSSTVFDESRVNKYNDSPRSKDDRLQSDDNSSFLHSSLNKCSPNWYLPRVIRVHVCYELGEEDRSYRRGSSGKKTLLPGVEVLKPENSSYLRSYFLKAFLFMKPRVVKIFTDSHGFKYSQLFVENIPSFIRTTEVFQSDADLGAYLSSLLHDRDITQLTKPLLILITSADPNSTLKKNVFDLLKSVTRIRNIFLVVSTLLCTNSRTRQFNKKLCDLSRKYHYQVWDINKIAFKFRNKKNVNCF